MNCTVVKALTVLAVKSVSWPDANTSLKRKEVRLSSEYDKRNIGCRSVNRYLPYLRVFSFLLQLCSTQFGAHGGAAAAACGAGRGGDDFRRRGRSVGTRAPTYKTVPQIKWRALINLSLAPSKNRDPRLAYHLDIVRNAYRVIFELLYFCTHLWKNCNTTIMIIMYFD